MNLGRVKSFLIFIFLAINIYLVASLVISSEFRIGDETIDNTVTILNNSGIFIDRGIIPKKAVNLTGIECENIIRTKRFEESENSNKFRIANDSFTCEVENSKLYFEKDKKIIKEIKSFLSDSGFDADNMQFGKIIDKGEVKTFEITCHIKKYQIFDSVINVDITKNGFSLSGMWYESNASSVISNSRTRNTVYITSILVDILENKDFKSNQIIDIELGYLSGSLYESSGYITASALPFYRLTDKENNVYYYDATDGSYSGFVN